MYMYCSNPQKDTKTLVMLNHIIYFLIFSIFNYLYE